MPIVRETVVEQLEPLPLGVDPIQNLGRNLKQMREKKGLDLSTVAAMGKLQPDELLRLENGETSSTTIHLGSLILIAEGLFLTLRLETARNFKPRKWHGSNSIGFMMDQGCRISLIND